MLISSFIVNFAMSNLHGWNNNFAVSESPVAFLKDFLIHLFQLYHQINIACSVLSSEHCLFFFSPLLLS